MANRSPNYQAKRKGKEDLRKKGDVSNETEDELPRHISWDTTSNMKHGVLKFSEASYFS
jgi:hypothetical protein